jgi:hypothetical protein
MLYQSTNGLFRFEHVKYINGLVKVETPKELVSLFLQENVRSFDGASFGYYKLSRRQS